MTKTLVGLMALCSIVSAFSFSAIKAGATVADQAQAQKLETYCRAGLQVACDELLTLSGEQ